MNSNTDLDPQELKFLAIQASRDNHADQALIYLKQAIRHAPADGELHYLLAAEHAQLGIYDRAAEGMERALALTPGLHTARLQLGLLYLTQANVEASTRTLAPLAERKDGNYFGLFALGLLHLMHDRFPACRAALTQGIALNEENDALNGDMKKILDALPPPGLAH
jgi:tetratricopeptide (TPR) repeat protein